MNRTVIHFAACAALLILAGACGTGGNRDDSAADAPQTSATGNAPRAAHASADGPTVAIKLIAFTPTDVRVAAGQTVTWRQDDVASHTVTSGLVEQSGGTAAAKPDGRFDSGTISKGENFQFSFTESGQYPFFCAVHPATMTGVVTVT